MGVLEVSGRDAARAADAADVFDRHFQRPARHERTAVHPVVRAGLVLDLLDHRRRGGRDVGEQVLHPKRVLQVLLVRGDESGKKPRLEGCEPFGAFGEGAGLAQDGGDALAHGAEFLLINEQGGPVEVLRHLLLQERVGIEFAENGFEAPDRVLRRLAPAIRDFLAALEFHYAITKCLCGTTRLPGFPLDAHL